MPYRCEPTSTVLRAIRAIEERGPLRGRDLAPIMGLPPKRVPERLRFALRLRVIERSGRPARYSRGPTPIVVRGEDQEPVLPPRRYRDVFAYAMEEWF